MAHGEEQGRLGEAVEQFNRRQKREDGAQVASCLASGLTILRESLYCRVHHDVEIAVGTDSMTMPLSESKAKRRTMREIEAYQIAESAAAARDFGYVEDWDPWYPEWLVRLRLGQDKPDREIVDRAKDYLAEPADRRCLAFSDELGRVLPESRRAPLVLFQLMPLAVEIATACAFADRDTALRLRQQQTAILPAITDCPQCQGKLLECVEQCRACGNPLWKYGWLTAVD